MLVLDLVRVVAHYSYLPSVGWRLPGPVVATRSKTFTVGVNMEKAELEGITDALSKKLGQIVETEFEHHKLAKVHVELGTGQLGIQLLLVDKDAVKAPKVMVPRVSG